MTETAMDDVQQIGTINSDEASFRQFFSKFIAEMNDITGEDNEVKVENLIRGDRRYTVCLEPKIGSRVFHAKLVLDRTSWHLCDCGSPSHPHYSGGWCMPTYRIHSAYKSRKPEELASSLYLMLWSATPGDGYGSVPNGLGKCSSCEKWLSASEWTRQVRGTHPSEVMCDKCGNRCRHCGRIGPEKMVFEQVVKLPKDIDKELVSLIDEYNNNRGSLSKRLICYSLNGEVNGKPPHICTHCSGSGTFTCAVSSLRVPLLFADRDLITNKRIMYPFMSFCERCGIKVAYNTLQKRGATLHVCSMCVEELNHG